MKYLVNDDINGLLQYSKEYGYIENETGYYSKCHLCLDLSKYLITKNDFMELQPKEFYAHLD